MHFFDRLACNVELKVLVTDSYRYVIGKEIIVVV